MLYRMIHLTTSYICLRVSNKQFMYAIPGHMYEASMQYCLALQISQMFKIYYSYVSSLTIYTLHKLKLTQCKHCIWSINICYFEPKQRVLLFTSTNIDAISPSPADDMYFIY